MLIYVNVFQSIKNNKIYIFELINKHLQVNIFIIPIIYIYINDFLLFIY